MWLRTVNIQILFSFINSMCASSMQSPSSFANKIELPWLDEVLNIEFWIVLIKTCYFFILSDCNVLKIAFWYNKRIGCVSKEDTRKLN